MNILYDFSSALLQARQNKGVTQEQIAFALDISQATYNAWECGHRLCPYKHIIALIIISRTSSSHAECFASCFLCNTIWLD